MVAAHTLLPPLAQGLRPDLNEHLKPPVFVPETLSGMELLEHFRQTSADMVFVVDEYGAVQGVITERDLLEAITGEFVGADPGEEAWATQRADGSWLMDGLIPIPELKDRLDLKEVPEEDRGRYNTLAGMVMLLLGRLPGTGDSVDWEGWRFEVVDLDGKRVDKLLVQRTGESEEGANMIIDNLHKQMVALDRNLHRNLKIHQPQMDWSVAAGLNAHLRGRRRVRRRLPRVPDPVRARRHRRAGQAAGGADRRARPGAAGEPVPAGSRRGARCTSRRCCAPTPLPSAATGSRTAWRDLPSTSAGPGCRRPRGWRCSTQQGEPGRAAQGDVTEQLEQIELEVQRTREVGRLLVEKDLLREMRFDAELPDGQKLKVDGFLSVDEKQLAQLGDADLLALHRNGVMGLVYAHLVSLGNLRKMVQWRIDAGTPHRPRIRLPRARRRADATARPRCGAARAPRRRRRARRRWRSGRWPSGS